MRREDAVTRHIYNPKIESHNARAKLKPSGRPTYFDLGGKLHLGYRKGLGAGQWVARRYQGDGRYVSETLAESDDLADANGETVLNFDQAQKRARAWGEGQEAKERLAALGPVITVANAVEAYIDERSTSHDAMSKLKHLLADAELARTPLAALTVDDLKKWRAGLLKKMGEASARRVVNDARACLNAAAGRHPDKLPATLVAAIRAGFGVPRGSDVENTREQQILSDPDVKRLIAAAWEIDAEKKWDGDLGRMILTLAATGARFSQVQRLRVADLQVAEGRLMMPTSRKGRGQKLTHTAIPLLPDVVGALKIDTRGRKGTDPLLRRPRWRRASGRPLGVVEKYARGPWEASSELTYIWKIVVARAGLPTETIPYAFRHSSIVRGLRAGLPATMAAALHDTSSTMIERYYGRFISDALHDLARAALVPLMPAPVEKLRLVEQG
jgi:integrase